MPKDLETCKSTYISSKTEEGRKYREVYVLMHNQHTQTQKYDAWNWAWCLLPLKDPNEFKKIKVFIPLTEHIPETGKFKDGPEIKREIDLIE